LPHAIAARMNGDRFKGYSDGIVGNGLATDSW
jgi:hypothetical protein